MKPLVFGYADKEPYVTLEALKWASLFEADPGGGQGWRALCYLPPLDQLGSQVRRVIDTLRALYQLEVRPIGEMGEVAQPPQLPDIGERVPYLNNVVYWKHSLGLHWGRGNCPIVVYMDSDIFWTRSAGKGGASVADSLWALTEKGGDLALAEEEQGVTPFLLRSRSTGGRYYNSGMIGYLPGLCSSPEKGAAFWKHLTAAAEATHSVPMSVPEQDALNQVVEVLRARVTPLPRGWNWGVGGNIMLSNGALFLKALDSLPPGSLFGYHFFGPFKSPRALRYLIDVVFARFWPTPAQPGKRSLSQEALGALWGWCASEGQG